MIQRADLPKMSISGQIVFEILAQLSPGYALITPYKPFEIFWGSTPKKFTDRIRTNYVPGSQIVGKTKNRT